MSDKKCHCVALWGAWSQYTYMTRGEQSASGHCCVWSKWGRAGCSRPPSSAASSPSFPSSSSGSRCTTESSRRSPAQPPCRAETWENDKTARCTDDISPYPSPMPVTAVVEDLEGDFQKAPPMPGYDSLFTFMFKLSLCPIFSGMTF